MKQLEPISSKSLERTLGMPPDGPKIVPFFLDFSVTTLYKLDYSNFQNRGFMSMVQTLWIYNLDNAATLDIFIPASQQTLKVPANTQGYFPVLCPNPVKMEFSSSGGAANCLAILCNFPVLV